MNDNKDIKDGVFGDIFVYGDDVYKMLGAAESVGKVYDMKELEKYKNEIHLFEKINQYIYRNDKLMPTRIKQPKPQVGFFHLLKGGKNGATRF